MASPPSLNRSLGFPRVTRFAALGDVQRWATDLLRALELQFRGGTSGVGGGTVGTGRFSPSALTQGINVIQPTAYPYTPQFSDLIILVDTSAARVIDLPLVSLGFVATIKDATGTAGANNITINAAGAELIDGSASYTISTNFASVSILGTAITGSEWVLF